MSAAQTVTSSDRLDVLDTLSHVYSLVEAIYMMANALLEREERDAFQRVASLAQDGIKTIRVALGETDDGEGE